MALIASSLLGVLVGAGLGSTIAPGILKTVAGVAFIAIGAWMLLSLPQRPPSRSA